MKITKLGLLGSIYSDLNREFFFSDFENESAAYLQVIFWKVSCYSVRCPLTNFESRKWLTFILNLIKFR